MGSPGGGGRRSSDHGKTGFLFSLRESDEMVDKGLRRILCQSKKGGDYLPGVL